MQKYREIILTFFYSGKAKKMPGTYGSAASTLLWLLVTAMFSRLGISLFTQNLFWSLMVISAFIYGALEIPNYIKNLTHKSHKKTDIDHRSIVLDEFVGQVLVLHPTFLLLQKTYFENALITIAHLILCFGLFRFFDILKPWPICYFDKKLKSGFGVMFDDVLAGIFAAAIGFGLITLLP